MMSDRFQSWAPGILGATRILAGVMFACHGAQKILGLFGGIPPEAKTALVITAGWIELVGGSLIALGLFTPFAAFICSGTMAVAYFKGHAFGTGAFSFWPTVNKGELAVLYCWFFLYLVAQGPGALALDNLMRRRSRAGNLLS